MQTRYDANLAINASYDYDGLDRLTYASTRHGDGTSALNRNVSWQYDVAGNIESRTENGVQKTYTYSTTGGRKRLTAVDGVGSLAYDDDGNTITSGNRTIQYTTANMPAALSNGVDSVWYSYGPDRSRTAKLEIRSGQSWWVTYVDPGFEIVTHNETGMAVSEYRYPLQVGNKVIATRSIINTNGTTIRRAEYYHHDALNSVEVVTDSIGRIQKRYHYDPYGKREDVTFLDVLDPTHPTVQGIQMLMTRGFTGHEHMDELDFIHMNGRVYDALTARFLSPDPMVQAPTSTQNHNRYIYTQDNPLKYTDPSGFSWLSDNWRSILGIAVAIVITAYCPFLSPQWAAALGGFAGGMIASGGDLRAGIVGAISGWAFYQIGSPFVDGNMSSQFGERIIAHGAVGGLGSVAQGGKFEHGFLSATASAFGGKFTSNMRGGLGPQTAVATIVGGVASVLGGGKFANGAVTGAFAFAFGRAAQAIKEARQEGAIYVTGHRVGEVGPYHLAVEYDRQVLSAGPVDGLLVSDANRPTDAPALNVTVGEVRPPAGMSAGAYFSRLQQADLRYCDCVDYDLFPGVMNSYNSNSYVHGLINATGGTSSVNFNRYFGGPKPLPPQYFGGP